MKYLLILIFFLLIVAFIYLGYSKIINRGLPKFTRDSRHRHPENRRRNWGDAPNITTTFGIPIILDKNVAPGHVYLVDTGTGQRVLIDKDTELT